MPKTAQPGPARTGALVPVRHTEPTWPLLSQFTITLFRLIFIYGVYSYHKYPELLYEDVITERARLLTLCDPDDVRAAGTVTPHGQATE
jgi:hypothetical protein